MSTRTPFTRVPLVDPRSMTANRSPCGRISAWFRLTFGSASTRLQSGWRPTLITDSVSEKRSPLGSTSEPAPEPPDALGEPAGDLERAGVEPVVHHQLHLHRAHERVALVTGVLAGRVAELPLEAVLHALELREVAGRQGHGEGVGHHGAASYPDRPVVVHLPHQPPPELHRTQAALERAGERTLHHALEAALEPPDSHRREAIGSAGTAWGDGGRRALQSTTPLGRVAELADALASGASVRKDVGVQVPPRPLSRRRSAHTRESCNRPTSTELLPVPRNQRQNGSRGVVEYRWRSPRGERLRAQPFRWPDARNAP